MSTVTPGPNIFGLKAALATWIESRISSAVSRRMSNRQRESLSGSEARASELAAELAR
jgi:hypothetical protein